MYTPCEQTSIDIWYAWLILGLPPANERRCYFVTTALIGWVQAWYQPWYQRYVVAQNIYTMVSSPKHPFSGAMECHSQPIRMPFTTHPQIAFNYIAPVSHLVKCGHYDTTVVAIKNAWMQICLTKTFMQNWFFFVTYNFIIRIPSNSSFDICLCY